MDFYKEFRELVYSKPHNATNTRAAENCAFGDYIFRSKNVYLGYFATDAEDCYYSQYLNKARDCADCAHLVACELCYECVDGSGLYNCSYLQDCHNCSHCSFCLDCINCKDCFGSFGLRQQRFCIFNKAYAEETYRKKMPLLKKNPPQKILKILQAEFDKHPRLYARLLKGGENCFGDYIYFSKNCYQCFNVHNLQDAAYVTEVMDHDTSSSDSADCDFAVGITVCYECDNVNTCTNCDFLANCINCSDCGYCLYCYGCMDCFGCFGLMNKQYCILNRQFTREEYVTALSLIKSDLKKASLYGKTLAEILK